MQTPQHIGIIMDGNGRWAQARRRSRIYGHLRGARSAKKIVEHCAQIGIPFLTLYTFSSENWSRPLEEVQFLMKLLSKHLLREKQTLLKNNIRFQTIGNRKRLPTELQTITHEIEKATAHCTGMLLTFALSYGGRQDIVEACQKIALHARAGKIDPNLIDEDLLAAHLSTAAIPDPDLIIRSSGEHRLSNFMVWQSAYSEIFITETLWPDFSKNDLQQALLFYSTRERRFGKTSSQLNQQINPPFISP